MTSTMNPGTDNSGAPADWSFTVFWTIRKYRHVETLEDFIAERQKQLRPAYAAARFAHVLLSSLAQAQFSQLR